MAVGAASPSIRRALALPMPLTLPAHAGWRGSGSRPASKSADLMVDEPQLRKRMAEFMSAPGWFLGAVRLPRRARRRFAPTAGHRKQHRAATPARLVSTIV